MRMSLRRPRALAASALLLLPATLLRAQRIPQYDLDTVPGRHVLVDREAGQYLGHPTTALLGDSLTLLTVYPKGHGRGAILYQRSRDGGQTWSGRLPTPDNWTTSLETPTIFRVPDPVRGGHRLLMFSGLYPARMASSDDDGATWSPLAPIGDWGGIVVMSSVVPMRDGSLLAFFHDDGRYYRQGGKAEGLFTLFQVRSRDGGRTWEEPRAIWSGRDLHLCEPGALRSPDGTRLALLLRENRRVATSQVIVTDDDGATWSAPRPLAPELTGDRHEARYSADGRVVVTFRDMAEGSPTKGDWLLWVGRWEDVIGGGAGQFRVRLKDNTGAWDSSYSGLERLKDGSFVATTYGAWTAGEQPYVLSVRLRLEEFGGR